MNLQPYWEEMLSYIKPELNPVAYNTWIKDLQPIKLKEDKLMLLVDNEPLFKTQAIKYEKIITFAANEVFNSNMEIIFVLPEELEDKNTPYSENIQQQPVIKSNSSDNLKATYVFQNFVVGESNKMAHAASVSVAENPGSAFNPLFLYGDSGLGKTHLMHAIANYILEQDPNKKVLYASCEQFTNELIASIKRNEQHKFKEKYRGLDVLLIDDIQFISNKESTQEEFFHTFNDLFNLEKQIIISSDRHPSEIKSLTERLLTRFSWGLIADVKVPDFETRTAIIEKKAENLNIVLPKEVSQFLAQSVDSNIRVLEGALTRVIAYVDFTKQPLNVEVAQKALKDVINSSMDSKLSFDSIKRHISDHYGISIEDLNSQRRTKAIADARQVAMYLCRELLNETYVSIGKSFDRDHSTAMHAIEKVEKRLKDDSGFKKEIKDLIDTITKR